MGFLQQSIIIFNLLTFLILGAISCQILHHSYYISAGTLPTSKRKKNGYRAIFCHSLIFNLLETNIRQRGDVGDQQRRLGKGLKSWNEFMESNRVVLVFMEICMFPI